jgi:hypothetical protein
MQEDNVVTYVPIAKQRLHGDRFLETNTSLCDKQTFPWIQACEKYFVSRSLPKLYTCNRKRRSSRRQSGKDSA